MKTRTKQRGIFKWRGICWRTENDIVLPIVGQKVPQCFDGYFKFFFGMLTFAIYIIVSYGTPSDVMRNPAGKRRSVVYILNSSRKITIKGSWCRVCSIVSRLRAGWSRGRDPDIVREIFLFCKWSRPALGPTKPPIQWIPPFFSGVQRPGRDVDAPV
jgi:hypothetical protein